MPSDGFVFETSFPKLRKDEALLVTKMMGQRAYLDATIFDDKPTFSNAWLFFPYISPTYEVAIIPVYEQAERDQTLVVQTSTHHHVDFGWVSFHGQVDDVGKRI